MKIWVKFDHFKFSFIRFLKFTQVVYIIYKQDDIEKNFFWQNIKFLYLKLKMLLK